MRYIVAVEEELHFSRAAERVRVAQPSLSKQIRNVEAELGLELFKRTHRKVAITEPGRAFVDNAKLALQYAERATSAARAANRGHQGILLLGVSPSVSLELFFRLRNVFEKEYGDIRLKFIPSFARDQAESIMRCDLHAGLVEMPIRSRGLAALNVLRESIVLVLSGDDDLASRNTITPEELIQRPLVLLGGHADAGHDKILTGIRDWGYRPEKVFKVLSLHQALDFVDLGEAIGAMRGSLTPWAPGKVVTKSLAGLPVVDTAIVYRRQTPSPMVRSLLRVAREVFSAERSTMTGTR